MTIKTFSALPEIGDSRYFLFKHSSTCPISASANRAVEKVHAELAMPIYKLVVQQQRQLSGEVTQEFGIRHESPQILLIDSGKVTWHESHYNITAKDILKAAE
jgi:bacillithiol system protein YtxJ